MMFASLILSLALTTPLARAADWPDLSTSPKGAREGLNDAALIVAIEDYSKVGDVAGAGQNADDWVTWFLQGRGLPASRIIQLRDADATDVAIRREAARVATMVKPGGTLWVLYVGHGAPSRDGRDGLLVGVDADRSAEGIYARSVPQKELFALLDRGAQAQTVAVVDACFSGQAGDGADLVAGLQPLIPTALLADRSARTHVLTATGPGEFSGPLPGVARPAFSYLALGALRGWADADGGNGDGAVSASEVREWVGGALGLTVRGRKQTPGLLGEDVVLGRALDTRAPDLAGLARGTRAVQAAATEPAPPSVTGGSTAGGDVSADVAALKRLKAMREAREAKLAELARAKAAEGAAAWTELSGVLSDGSAAEIAVVEKYVKTWTDAKVWVDDAEGRKERAVVVASIDAANAWLAKAGKGATGSDWVSPSLGTMKWIPAGTLTMGSPASEAGRGLDETQHRVTLTKGFWMMEHEVTQGEWQAVMGSNPVATGTKFWSGQEQGSCASVGVGADLPVACIDWEQANEFARRVSARDGVPYALPTEAQWEYAARGGSSQRFAGANEDAELCGVANVANGNRAAEYGRMGYDASSWSFAPCDDGVAGLARVKRYRPNGYGLYDMSGNVWEWTADWLGAYPSTAVTDPRGDASGAYRVYRGGSWDYGPRSARVAGRNSRGPAIRSGFLGFRLSRTGP